jgi:hypothetical protein
LGCKFGGMELGNVNNFIKNKNYSKKVQKFAKQIK